MKQQGRRVFQIILAVIVLVTAIGGMPLQTEAAPTFQMNRTKKTMVIGSSYQFRVADTASSKVTWTSSNKRVASVSRNGKVTAKRKGKAVIRANVKKNGKTTTYKCTVIVITQQKSYETDTVRLINKQRRRYGRPSLDYSAQLQKAADKRAKEVATKKYSAKRPNGTYFTSAIDMDYNYARAGQTIGCDFATPADIVDAWMNTAGTKAHILSRYYTDVAVSVYLADDGYLYWVAIFACRK